VPFKAAKTPLSRPLMTAPQFARARLQSFMHNPAFAFVRVPLGWHVDSALHFALAHQFALSFSWRRVDSRSPFHNGASGLHQLSGARISPSCMPSHSGVSSLALPCSGVCMCALPHYAPLGSNASGFAAVAISAPPASSMPAVPS